MIVSIKNIGSIIKNQSEITNAISKMKDTLEGKHSKLKEAEDWISDLEDKGERKNPIRAGKNKFKL